MIETKVKKLSPLLKYPGGKEKELSYILPKLPQNANRYFEPFLGGGAVYFALNSEKYFVNDFSPELISLYKMVKTQDVLFFNRLETINRDWIMMDDVVKKHHDFLLALYNQFSKETDNTSAFEEKVKLFVETNSKDFNGMLLPDFNYDIDHFIDQIIKNLKNKMTRMKKIEKTKGELSEEDKLLNIETAFKSAFYMHFRYMYNNVDKLGIETAFEAAIYFYIREYCYSSMFRYNLNGDFNVPYGGLSYNKKNLSKKIQYFRSKELLSQLESTQLYSEDFESFLEKQKLQDDDFIFLDPPYDTDFSTYAKNEFNKNDQIRLANYLINQCKANFLLVIKETELIKNLYTGTISRTKGTPIIVSEFKKKYTVSFQDRNNKNANHLIIKNY
jgi:DNA adenine methylase